MSGPRAVSSRRNPHPTNRPPSPPPQDGPHRRNRHRERYDFTALRNNSPELADFIVPHPGGGDTIDFSDPTAVLTLNRAILKHHYGLTHWDIPRGYLCPPIPGRADYLHHVADLLSDGSVAAIPRGPSVTVLDIGVGANCVYPIIGVHDYGWRFVGTDIDRDAVNWANQLVAANRTLSGLVDCRLQRSATDIFNGVVRSDETFALSICNPPFHSSPEEAAAGTLRKLRNLGDGKTEKPVLNFGGKSNELWCQGGEAGFIRRMIAESAQRRGLCLWFTTLVSKRGSLPAIYHAVHAARAADVRTIAMAQGQKKSRIVAWTFQSAEERRGWRARW